MAAGLGTLQNTGDTWASQYWTIWHNLTATVTRSGNTVTLSNVTAYFHLKGTAGYAWAGQNGNPYGPTHFTLSKTGATSQSSGTQNWTWGNLWAPYDSDLTSYSIPNFSFGVNPSDTSANVTLTWYGMGSDQNSTTWTITFSSGGGKPNNGYITNISTTEDSITATVGVSWNGNTSNVGKELCVLQPPDTVETAGMPQYYMNDTTTATETTFTVDNDSQKANNPQFSIGPNTAYNIGIYAKNSSGDYRYTYPDNPVVTKSAAATVSASSIGATSVTIDYSTSADGGYYDKEIQYSIDGGNTWTTGATVTTGAVETGSFTISGLSSGAVYNIQTRVATYAGDTVGSTVSVITISNRATLYGSVSDQSTKIKKLYCSVGGQSRRVRKLYASVGGVTKLIYGG